MRLISLTPANPLRVLFLLVFAFFLGLTSCDDQDEAPLQNAISDADVEDVATEEQLETTFEDIDLISVEANDRTEDGDLGGREQMDETDMLTRCATITHDKEAKTITIDFGDGCEGPDGKIRSGIIFISYTKRMFIPGAVLTITLENYTVNGLAIEGSKTITNVSEDLQDNVSFNKVLTGGKITWPDGTYATRDSDKTFTWYRASNPLLDEVHVTGVANGQTRRGVVYDMEILSTIIWKRSCRVRGICVPVQGLKLFTIVDHPDVLVDFGDGECENQITITKSGESKLVNVDCHKRD
ncbi:MAG: hypothetical protein OER04_04755 [Cyclobacteriaceae bacterium]|nr:hypothetical protein [Cyclobacteriaceae bacterium]